MALDHPGTVTRLAVLDIVPTGEAFRRADMDFSLGFWLWSFLAAPEPVSEQLVVKAPAVIVDHMLDALSEVSAVFPAEHDEADRGKRRITCPVLVLWSYAGALASWYEPLEVWRAWCWCDQVRGGPVRAGHFLPEEAPDQTTRHLLEFLA